MAPTLLARAVLADPWIAIMFMRPDPRMVQVQRKVAEVRAISLKRIPHILSLLRLLGWLLPRLLRMMGMTTGRSAFALRVKLT